MCVLHGRQSVHHFGIPKNRPGKTVVPFFLSFFPSSFIDSFSHLFTLVTHSLSTLLIDLALSLPLITRTSHSCLLWLLQPWPHHPRGLSSWKMTTTWRSRPESLPMLITIHSCRPFVPPCVASSCRMFAAKPPSSTLCRYHPWINPR